jgi:dihydrofolate reductase
MAKLVFGMNQSLDGYVDHMAFSPSPTLFRHFIEEAQGQAGSVYGRQMYEVMRYWDDDHPDWVAEEHAFAAAWRKQPKWVVSRSLKSVGPNATLVDDDLEGAIRELKAERDGEIEVAGPGLAQSLTELGLIGSYLKSPQSAPQLCPAMILGWMVEGIPAGGSKKRRRRHLLRLFIGRLAGAPRRSKAERPGKPRRDCAMLDILREHCRGLFRTPIVA